MPLTLLPDPQDWLRAEHTVLAVNYLLEIAGDHDDAPLRDLADDALTTLERCRHIAFRYGNRTIETDCEYAGRYRWDPPVIEVSRSRSRARDAFTALHEYGHHLQKTDDTWALDVLGVLPEFTRHRLEENVANSFASHVLISDVVLNELFSGNVTAQLLAELHASTAASRHAVIRRAAALTAEPTLIVVTNHRGEVVAAISNDSTLYTPPRGSHQPDLARLAATAHASGTTRGRTETGLQYGTGKARSDLSIELHPDYEGFHFFSVITPTYRFGSQQWDEELVECNNEACAATFIATPRNHHDACGGHRCPVCHACGCERRAVPICPHCTLELSAGEVAAGLVEHNAC